MISSWPLNSFQFQNLGLGVNCTICTIIGQNKLVMQFTFVDKTLIFRTQSIGKLSLCVKDKRLTICGGFELFHAGNVVLDARNKEAYLFGNGVRLE